MMYSNSFRFLRDRDLGNAMRANGLHCTERFAKESLHVVAHKASLRMMRRRFMAFERLLSCCRVLIERKVIPSYLLQHEVDQVTKIVEKKVPEIEAWIVEMDEKDLSKEQSTQ